MLTWHFRFMIALYIFSCAPNQEHKLRGPLECTEFIVCKPILLNTSYIMAELVVHNNIMVSVLIILHVATFALSLIIPQSWYSRGDPRIQ